MAERIEIETEGRPSEPPVVSCGTYNAPTGRIVLGTEQGELLLYDAAQANLAHWIVLPNGCKVRAIATGPGAKVYGYCGADDSIGEIFVLDLRGPQARLLGIPQVDSEPRFWTTHRCDCAVMGPQGEVYLGEADRISHLVVYRPASEENLHSHPRENS
ncbi:MAG: hypothetical protein DMG13_26060 [Acidobacteria bacterium]|nr:MAG: hypothetical protein DMG13_26060 [Acidobacteriota bacterium]